MTEKLKLKKYKKGDKLVGTYLGEVAGEDLQIGSAYGIHADIFDKGKYYQVPNVWSENKGSGMFLYFLVALKQGLDKPVYFCTITNMGLYKYLHKAGIGEVVYESKKPTFYNIEPVVAYSRVKQKPLKKGKRPPKSNKTA
jgi:hypothetical protein